MRISKLPASQQRVGTVTPAFDQPCTSALPLQIVCRLLGVRASAAPNGTSPTCLNPVPSHIHTLEDTPLLVTAATWIQNAQELVTGSGHVRCYGIDDFHQPSVAVRYVVSSRKGKGAESASRL